ncbi:UDP-glucosyltransferase 2 [Drosophila obscura]|uniref:UDP-glucosyltransferase 2 n=1 Tax=Drosophila obscura TaxID=7282 RepID=UPI001BB21794|nr:UDP-glucosyltransferase 2 [Drosophila obscura]
MRIIPCSVLGLCLCLGLALALFALLPVTAAEQRVQSSKILAVFPFTGRSQYIFAEQYLKELSRRGHNVTVINTFGSDQNEPNFRVIGATKIHELMAAFSAAGFSQSAGQWKMLTMTTDFLNMLTANVLEDAAVRDLLASGEGTFDLVIMETVQNEALFGLAQHFGALTIGISSYGTDRHIDELMGNISPLSYNPMLLSSRTEQMNYAERLWNVWEAAVVWLHKRLIHLPSQRQLYGQYFPQAQLSLEQVMDSFALMLLGQHFSLSYARAYLPDMIEVGGLHLQQQRQVQPLPADIAAFVEQSPNGVIYFSMGSNIKSADLPPTTRKVLLDTLASLPQRVLWKFEDDQLEDKPENVFIGKWFPQPDILAHPNVKLFITHGGLLSTIESIYFGKPVLGLPVFYDQHLNVQRAKQAGYGLAADLWRSNSTELQSLIRELLDNPTYTEAAQIKSKLYRDQKETPLERAIWWTEYVLRHQGATHLRCASRQLNFMQLHGLDTWAVIGAVAVLSLLVVVFALKLLIEALCYVITKRRGTPNKLKKQ